MRCSRTAAVLYSVSLLLAAAADSAPVSRARAAAAARSWLADCPAFGPRARRTSRGIVTYVAEFANREGRILAHCFAVDDGGFLILVGDDRLPPVFGFATRGTLQLAEHEGNLLPDILRGMLGARLALVDAATDTPIRGEPEAWRESLLAASARATAQWQALLNSPSRTEAGREYDVNIGPFMTTAWNQGTDRSSNRIGNPTFNYYTPELDRSGILVNAYAGCVATCMAQVLKYHDWPPRGMGEHTYQWKNPDTGQTEAVSQTFDTAYDWGRMRDWYYWDRSVTDPPSSEEEREAVGRLLYDCAVAAEMNFGAGNSTAYMSRAAMALQEHLRCSSATHMGRSTYHTAEQVVTAIRADILAGRPCMGMLSNHVVNIDGLRRETGSETDFYHLNFGYHGYNSGWYDVTSSVYTNQGEPPVADYMDFPPPYDSGYHGRIEGGIVDIVPGVYMDDLEGAGSATFTVSWKTSARLAVSRYELQEIPPGASDWVTVSAALTAPSHAFSGRPLGAYRFRARAYAFDAWQAWSEPIDYEVVANPQRTLTLAATEGGTTDPAPASYTYAQHAQVQVRAVPEAHRSFVRWSDGTHEFTTNPLTYTVSRNATVTAHFAPTEYALTVVSEYGAPSPAGGLYVYGTQVACGCGGSPEDSGEGVRHRLSGWTLTTAGDITTGSGDTVEVTVAGDAELTWNWVPEYRVDVAWQGGTVSVVTPAGPLGGPPFWVAGGTRATVSCRRWSWIVFDHWGGDVPSDQDPERSWVSVLVDSPVCLVAEYIDLVDSDYDGLHDPWELQYWESVEAAGSGANDNPDGDAFANSAEMENRTHPLRVTSAVDTGWSLLGTACETTPGETTATQFAPLGIVTAWWYDSSTGTYLTVGGNPGDTGGAAMEPCHGYWVQHLGGPGFAEIAGERSATRTLAVPAGWVLVSPVTEGELSAVEPPPVSAWAYQDGAYVPVTGVLSAGRGYWFWYEAATTVTLP